MPYLKWFDLLVDLLNAYLARSHIPTLLTCGGGGGGGVATIAQLG
jgi:hypothetical protein